MVAPSFSIARLPRIEFGDGALKKVPSLAAGLGRRALLVTGARSFVTSPHWTELTGALGSNGVEWMHIRVGGEPSPEFVDQIVTMHADQAIEVVIGIGGGSVLDAAKAIAGLLRVGRSVMEYLEGVGPERPYEGPAVPFIAVPTTAGTGSEATKNAVLSTSGPDAFKKSFRDDRLVAQYAVVDPQLLASCPSELIAANGMDALTQLIESYVSLRANPLTDALALSGLAAVRDGLMPWFENGVATARANMAYAALLSGIALAQTGLGSVHGLASPLGAYFSIPHGTVCGTLLAAATDLNLRSLRERATSGRPLAKYRRVATVLCGRKFSGDEEAHAALVALLEEWTERLKLPGLAQFGVDEPDFDRVVANARGSSMKTNPIVLSDDELRGLLRSRL